MNADPTAPPEDPREPAGRFEWERLLRRVIMPARTKLVAFVLASYADKDGSRVRPGVEALAAVTGQGASTVRRLLRELRDDYGLIEQMHRGGGRNGRGRTTEYRLTIPVDLLDRVEMLTPAERTPRMSAHLTSVQTGPPPVDNSDTALVQGSAQSGLSPVDNSPNTAHPDERSNVDGNDFHRSLETDSEALSAQNGSMSARSADQLPPTRPTTQDHPTTPDPAQPQTAPTDRAPIDLAGGQTTEPRAAPSRCEHGLVRRLRADQQPTCALCRRAKEPT